MNDNSTSQVNVSKGETNSHPLAKSGCLKHCEFKETIVFYNFRDPIDMDFINCLAKVGSLYVDENTGIFKIAKLDRFYIFGLLGECEFRICMFSYDKLSDRFAIDRQIIEYFRLKAEESVSDGEVLELTYNKSGSLAQIVVSNRPVDGESLKIHTLNDQNSCKA